MTEAVHLGCSSPGCLFPWKGVLFHCIRRPVTWSHQPMWASEVQAGHKSNSLWCQLRLTCAVVLMITWSDLAKRVISTRNHGTVCQTERHLQARVLGFHNNSWLNLSLQVKILFCKWGKKKIVFFFWSLVLFCFSLIFKGMDAQTTTKGGWLDLPGRDGTEECLSLVGEKAVTLHLTQTRLAEKQFFIPLWDLEPGCYNWKPVY